MPSTIIPLGDFFPDRRQLANPGLLRAYGVVPLAGNYIRAPATKFVGTPAPSVPEPLTSINELTAPPFGFYIHSSDYGYCGTEEQLFEFDLAALAVGDPGEVDRSRTSGGVYTFNTSPPGPDEFWWFTSFGSNVIATNFKEPVQYLPTPGSGDFEAMITSTFAPRAKLAFPILGNLFLAHCALDVSYDGIATGTHPQLVAWTQTNNLRVLGTETGGDPSAVGSGYQNIDNDWGAITAGIGGDYGLIFQERGITLVEGPPYRLRGLVEGDSTVYPYSVFRLGDDVYFWGAGGPSVLRGGQPPVIRLGRGKLIRSLLDNVTGFGSDFARAVDLPVREVSGVPDSSNELLRFAYKPIAGAGGARETDADDLPPTLFLDYNVNEERFGVSRVATIGGFGSLQAPRDLFLRTAPLTTRAPWGPFGRIYALHLEGNIYLVTYELDGTFQASYPDIVLQKGFGHLAEGIQTRIAAVRPVWSGTPANVEAITSGLSVTIESKLTPSSSPVSFGPFTQVSPDGWIGTPTTKFAAYHSPSMTFNGEAAFDANEVHEIEAFEVEYEIGGRHGA